MDSKDKTEAALESIRSILGPPPDENNFWFTARDVWNSFESKEEIKPSEWSKKEGLEGMFPISQEDLDVMLSFPGLRDLFDLPGELPKDPKEILALSKKFSIFTCGMRLGNAIARKKLNEE